MNAVTGPNSNREQELVRLVETYQTSLRRMSYAILRDVDQAQDAVQETFLKAYKGWDAFRGECSEKTWLMRIAVNVCRDLKRSGWFRHLDRRITPEELPLAANPEDERVELTLAIMRLPERLKEVVLLYYYQRMTMLEIAQALNIPQSTVSTRMKRARDELRTWLEGGEAL